ncbi:hypothetical protein Ga0102493_11796 [Erythrobacter litoralis]|uniref:Uncharacterized protein n=1 Tax=Erythrobacter litoralis TaxID=39960 RepID=A0A074MSG4_9SPHN|nr:hypothetical protein [Erythrobacter litoralis]AOL24925.1 hypothetical protein Ga0102493_11796 [Erythrobacter litoralis]KEO96449.1 hypothetical protein EH32_09470 [Erythrobacter litoralis]
MKSGAIRTATKRLRLPRLAVIGALAIALPSAGLALVTSGNADSALEATGFDLFTPASVDPQLAARVAERVGTRGIRFTPAGSASTDAERTVTVAVRIDDGRKAQAISVRDAIKQAPGTGTGIAALTQSKFNLGTARGYQSFARTIELPSSVRDMSMPDLAEFEPSRRKEEPSRLKPRIELEPEQIAGRSPNTLDSISAQTVGVGGSFSLSPNLDVTAGVRYSQERERLDPLTNSVKDSQAVYVGTQIKF